MISSSVGWNRNPGGRSTRSFSLFTSMDSSISGSGHLLPRFDRNKSATNPPTGLKTTRTKLVMYIADYILHRGEYRRRKERNKDRIVLCFWRYRRRWGGKLQESRSNGKREA